MRILSWIVIQFFKNEESIIKQIFQQTGNLIYSSCVKILVKPIISLENFRLSNGVYYLGRNPNISQPNPKGSIWQVFHFCVISTDVYINSHTALYKLHTPLYYYRWVDGIKMRTPYTPSLPQFIMEHYVMLILCANLCHRLYDVSNIDSRKINWYF